MDEKIVNIETKLAFQEDLIEQLNEVVTRQESDIIELQAQVKKMFQMLSSMDDSGIKDISQETPPPHY